MPKIQLPRSSSCPNLPVHSDLGVDSNGKAEENTEKINLFGANSSNVNGKISSSSLSNSSVSEPNQPKYDLFGLNFDDSSDEEDTKKN